LGSSWGPSSVSLNNNTIAGNAALDRRGGGVFSDGSSFAAISNSIVWFNGQDLYNCTATFSCFESASETDGKNNIAKYPHFVDPEAGDYHLKSYSPCVQMGRNSVVPAGSADVDYDPRILFGTVDIGADEVIAISPDTDEDGLPDDWEIEHFEPLLPPGHELDETGSGDYDEDGLTNLQEFVMGTSPTFDASVIYVDDDATGFQDGSLSYPFDSIQKGVNRSRGIVYVAGGTYDEEVVVRGKAIEIRGGYDVDFEVCDPDTYPSTVRASHASPALTGRAFTFDDSPSGLLTGFVITEGNASLGGGILCRASSPTISQNSILENQATVGGGIYLCEGSSATITNNRFDSNTARDGGAIACVQSAAKIENNEIGKSSPNEADRCGGGIYCHDSGGVTITGNEICSNCARFQGGGLAFYKCRFPLPASASEAPLRANVIKDNRAASGGGLAFEYSLNPTMVWNTVVANTALEGAGIFMSFTTGAGTTAMPVADIENNTIADNEAADPF
ncbi:MAG TPA: right-handed parallel beta-helix repeat-containing protein, partial [bacterium]|nr:right-handed parallel beta-helix repeat-containing protein [bacterium]